MQLFQTGKMVDSDRSETEEGDMERPQLSSDSVTAVLPKKRLRVENSEDETDLPAKKWQSSFNERSQMLKTDNTETISNKNNTNRCDVKEKRYILGPENEQNIQEISESDTYRKNKDEQDDSLKQESENKSALENNIALDKSPGEINIKEEIVENMKKDDISQDIPITNTSVTSISENKKAEAGDKEMKEEMDKMINRAVDNEEDEIKKNRHTAKKHTVDTEVVDGLELSVECASDKEDSSSASSEDEKDRKPRPKTIIIKAEPNESELDCSEGEEKSDSQQIRTDTLEIKSEKSRTKKRGSRTSFSKLKASGSEDSQNSNSDEDYSPRTKKKMKKSPTTKRLTSKHRSVESKKGRGRGIRRNSHKNNADVATDDVPDDEDAYTTVAESANKTIKTKNGMEEELSEKESWSKSESNNSEKEEKISTKGRSRRRSNANSQDKQIQTLKKYLNIAGVKVKSYNDIWADCKSNAAKIKRLKELLEKNGISGRPTLEKCKRAREENEKMREVSELDTSNIISEGRITRARRNMENVKKIILPDTPQRHREARNTFKRIQTVVDSDSDSE